MSAKRKGRPESWSVGCDSELKSEMNDDSEESTSVVDLLTKKMDTVLAKLQKLDSTENR